MMKVTSPEVLERPATVGALPEEKRAQESRPPVLPVFVESVSGARGVTSGGTIFYDGSEGSTSPWTVLGDPTWGVIDYRAAAGAYASYCVGSAIAPPGPYVNGMSAWRIAGPFDLSGVSSATFRYKLYYETEADRDYVRALVSTDGDDFYGLQYSGTSQGWVNGSIDLTNVPTLGNVCGKNQVWIAFRFVSDSSVTYEGAYVDEVSITGGGGSGGGEVGLILTADRSTVSYAGRTDFTGALLDATSGFLLPDREVGLYWSQQDKIGGTWNLLDTATSSTGEYSMAATNIQRLTYFALVFDGDGQYSTGMSNLVKVKARAKVTPPAVPSRVRAGVLVKSWGTIKPLHTAAQNKASHTRVFWERNRGGRWLPIYSGFAKSYRNMPPGENATETQYGAEIRCVAGKWRVRAVHQDGDHVKTTSSWRGFTAY